MNQAQTPSDAADTTAVPESLTRLQNAPGHLFRRALQLHDSLWHRHVGESITPLQFATLTALDAEPGLNQRDLGNRIALDKSTVGDLVERLARRGYLTRTPDPTDGRRRILEITEQGTAALVSSRSSVGQIGRIILSHLEPDEKAELIRLLSKVIFDQPPADGTDAGD